MGAARLPRREIAAVVEDAVGRITVEPEQVAGELRRESVRSRRARRPLVDVLQRQPLTRGNRLGDANVGTVGAPIDMNTRARAGIPEQREHEPRIVAAGERRNDAITEHLDHGGEVAPQRSEGALQALTARAQGGSRRYRRGDAARRQAGVDGDDRAAVELGDPRDNGVGAEGRLLKHVLVDRLRVGARLGNRLEDREKGAREHPPRHVPIDLVEPHAVEMELEAPATADTQAVLASKVTGLPVRRSRVERRREGGLAGAAAIEHRANGKREGAVIAPEQVGRWRNRLAVDQEPPVRRRDRALERKSARGEVTAHVAEQPVGRIERRLAQQVERAHDQALPWRSLASR
ncbi:MAG: hypothetical protein FJX56_11025 [Alphaproteobacteria bacterium]|nr:hypothetical protein [Alphaproteobacteria bacterium]